MDATAKSVIWPLAETARRRRDNTSLVDLVNPHLKDAASTVVQAREGVWNAETEVLDLVGDRAAVVVSEEVEAALRDHWEDVTAAMPDADARRLG